MSATTHVPLHPYAPLLLREWLNDEPDTLWRSFDGTLVFVDISGFTKLSERLARAGNIGAEELTDTIGTCFSGLLGVAYAAGGSLLKFGGDALLLLFRGDGHAERGCRAAVGMRAALRRLGRIETSTGRVVLRMSIGVHSGPIHLFLVGGSHREFMISGPGATQTVTMEAAADAGQIVISDATSERLPRSVVGAATGPGHLLSGAPPGEDDEGFTAADVDDELLRLVIPVALRTHLESEGRDAEHRRVTVAFLKFKGIDERLRDDGEDATAQALDTMIRVAQQGADRHGVTFLGSDVDAGGGKILLTSGAPTSGGNDEERMLLALRDIVEQACPIPFQIGVHAGPVFAGDIGPPYRRAYTVMGDAVNLAARVMSRSSPGEILATDDVLDSSRTTFKTAQLEPFMVKGKSRPVIASSVGPPVGVRSSGSSGDVVELPFVGRETELATFDELAARACEGSGHLLAVVGDAGIGKSRLLAAFRERTTDRPVYALVCELHRESTSYWSVRKLLRTLLGTASDASPEQAASDLLASLDERLPHLVDWAPLLAIAYGTELPATETTAHLDEQFLRPRLHELVIEVLATVWSGPVLATIEDSQWMDEASADILRSVSARLNDHPWVLCLTRRERDDPDPAEDAPVTTMVLEPLDAASSQALGNAATEAAPISVHDMNQIVERCAGNPLFLQELVVAAREAGGVESLPGSVESLMTARVDRLPHDLREVLREVSVLGYSFPRDLAVAVLSEGGAERLLELSEFLTHEDEVVRFRHAMTRDAAYGGLAYRRRRALHAAAGDTIAASGDDRPELLSFHYYLAARYEDAWHASLRAGAAAAAVYANSEAARFYGRALDAARRLPDLDPAEVARVSEALGDALLRMGELEKASDAYRAAARTLRDEPVGWARVLLKDARIKAQLKWYSQALAAITRGLRRLTPIGGDGVDTQRAQLTVWYGHLRLEQGRHKDAIEWSQRAIEVAEASGDRDALAHAYRLLDWAYTESGRPELATYSTRALDLYEDLSDLPSQATVLNNLGAFAYWQGRWQEALDYYRRANELEDRFGDVIVAAQSRNNIAEILADQGRWDEATELFREAERVLRAAGFASAVAYVRANLGRTAARAGRFVEAADLLEEARRGALEAGAVSRVIDAEARLAELHVFRGHSEEALRLAEGVLRRTDAAEGAAVHQPLLHRVRGYALLQRGDVQAARQALHDSAEAARAQDAEYERALAERGLCELATAEGEPDPRISAASQRTFASLGVERLPTIPLRETARDPA